MKVFSYTVNTKYAALERLEYSVRKGKEKRQKEEYGCSPAKYRR